MLIINNFINGIWNVFEKLGTDYVGMCVSVLYVAVLVVSVLVLHFWCVPQLLSKMGKNSKRSYIPFLNAWEICKEFWGKGWYAILLFVPIVGFFFYAKTIYKIAYTFGKNSAFAFKCSILPAYYLTILVKKDEIEDAEAENIKKGYVAGGVVGIINVCCILCVVFGMIDINNKENGMEEYKLTDRQKAILTVEGLPTDIDKLSDGQISAISSIETMLEYLENKYGVGFVYVDYVSPLSGEEEELMAFRVDDPEKKVVSVTRKYEGDEIVYEDNAEIASKDVDECYRKMMDSYISKYFENGKYKFFYTLKDVDDNWTEKELISSVRSSNEVFIDVDSYPDFDTMKFMKEFGSWIEKQKPKHVIGVSIFFVKSDDLKTVNEQNYSDYIFDSVYKARHDFRVNNSEGLVIFE